MSSHSDHQPDPPPAPSARFALRAATAEAHTRLDALYATLDLAKPDDYARFLTSHAAVFLPMEDALDAAGAETVQPGWRATRRADALRADLAALGLPVPAPTPVPPLFGSEASVLGGLYVLEGSRLGGALLVRAVQPALPTGFLTPGNPALWRSFTAKLDVRLTTPAALGDATAAAIAVFGVFERSARDHLDLRV